MPNKVRHLRGTDAEWAENDAVIDDGEIALALSPAGNYRIKIGNGTNKFSELDMLGGEVKNIDETVITMKHADDVRCGERPRLYIYFENPRDEDFYSILTFDSGATATEFIYPNGLLNFSGESLSAGKFVPEAKMHYTLVFWDDGSLIQCHVRGCSNA